MGDLKADPERTEFVETGIPVRALGPDGKWRAYDIVHLDGESLVEWLRSRGGDNPWAENVVGILLGHGNLHTQQED